MGVKDSFSLGVGTHKDQKQHWQKKATRSDHGKSKRKRNAWWGKPNHNKDNKAI